LYLSLFVQDHPSSLKLQRHKLFCVVANNSHVNITMIPLVLQLHVTLFLMPDSFMDSQDLTWYFRDLANTGCFLHGTFAISRAHENLLI
jgi:hypothetical protein